MHWTTRGIMDKNKSLWGSWAVWEVHPEPPQPEPEPEPEPEAAQDNVSVWAAQLDADSPSRPLDRVGLALWFSGDTGYCDTFQTIGEYFRWRFGRQLPFSVAIIGIGACECHDTTAIFGSRLLTVIKCSAERRDAVDSLRCPRMVYGSTTRHPEGRSAHPH
jgi:hypothetical protein